jgi:hypothetical protein
VTDHEQPYGPDFWEEHSPDDLPPLPEVVTVRLTAPEAEAVVCGLRGWARHQMAGDPDYAEQFPEPEHDPWPGELDKLACKIELAWIEATADGH